MRLISYFIPKILYKGSTAYNKDIKVIEVMGSYKLLVNGTVQSFSKNSRQAKNKIWGGMARIISKNPEIKNILLLGMGAGTLLQFLKKQKPMQDLHTTSVEIDPVIVSLALKYFSLGFLSNNTVIEGDAYEVVQNPSAYSINSRFDCVVVDTYSGTDFPSKLTSEAFYRNVMSLMSPNGLLVVNRIINKNDTTTLPSVTKELKKYLQHLEVQKVKCPVVSDNYIFYGKTL